MQSRIKPGSRVVGELHVSAHTRLQACIGSKSLAVVGPEQYLPNPFIAIEHEACKLENSVVV